VRRGRGRRGTAKRRGLLKIRVNALELYCTVEGPADAPAVVFVHGLAASSSVWESQAQRLRDRFRVVRYDLRSHGRSQAAEAACTRSELAHELIGLLDALGIERAFLVGHSAGGVIAMHAALEHGGRVLGLVLVGTASECNDKTAAWYANTAEVAREKGGIEAVRAMGLRPRADSVPDGLGFAQMALAMRTLNQDPLTPPLRSVARFAAASWRSSPPAATGSISRTPTGSRRACAASSTVFSHHLFDSRARRSGSRAMSWSKVGCPRREQRERARLRPRPVVL
jgi:pimeloyl-ACP methyl ester carboxylesterase